jgi:hypothetical protein
MILKHDRILKWPFVLLLLLLASCTYLPELEENTSYENIRSETGDYILLSDATMDYDRIFLFIPGGLVDPHVYLCWMDELVQQTPGMAIVSVKFPTNLAILNRGKIRRVMKEFEEVQNWVIGGHSLGGVVAAKEIEEQPELFDGLIFLGSWTTSFADLGSWDGFALSIYGSNDGLSSPEEILENDLYLPEGIAISSSPEIRGTGPLTFYYEIQGANHSGFGCYGLQEGDDEAEISPELQQEEMNQLMSYFLNFLWD